MQSNEKASREGDTLCARYFRWKDKLFAGVTASGIFDKTDPSKKEETMEAFTQKAQKVHAAQTALRASPDDQASFDSAVSLAREMASIMKDMGHNVNLEAVPE